MCCAVWLACDAAHRDAPRAQAEEEVMKARVIWEEASRRVGLVEGGVRTVLSEVVHARREGREVWAALGKAVDST